MAQRNVGRWALFGLLGLLLLGLGGYGTGSFGTRAVEVGRVDGQPITARAYAAALTSQLRALEEQAGQPLPFEQAQALGIDRAVLSSLVASRALDAEAARLGLSAGDERVAQAVVSVPAFQGLDGAFDRDLYAEALRRNGLDERTFEATVREEATRSILQAAIVGGVPAQVPFAAAVAAYQGERRVVTWASVAGDAAAPPPEPTDAEARAYYDDNPDAFTAPEVREVSYAWLTPEMIRDGIEVDASQVRALYDERLDQYVQEERRLMERLVFPDAAAAQAARARLDAGEATFEELVGERGLALPDVDLGDVGRGDLGAAADPVFAAAAGDVVGPVPTDLGPALLRVNAVLAADETPFEDAEPELRRELADEAARGVIDDAAAGLADLIAGGAGIDDLAQQTDLEEGSLAWSEGIGEGVAAYQAFRDAVAAAAEGGLPEVVRLEDGGVVALRLDRIAPPALRAYEEVADEARATAAADAARAAVLAAAAAAAEAVAGGATFEAQGLTPTTEPPLTRRDVVEGTPPEFMARAFALAPGEAAALPLGDGALVLRVDSAAAPDPTDEGVAAEQAALAQQAASSLAQDFLAAYVAAIQADAEVRIDDAAVAAVTAQMQ